MHHYSGFIFWYSKSITTLIILLHKLKFPIIYFCNKLFTFTFQTSGLQILLGVHLYQFYRIVKYYYVLTNFTLFFNFTYHTIFLFSHCLQGIRLTCFVHAVVQLHYYMLGYEHAQKGAQEIYSIPLTNISPYFNNNIRQMHI